LIPATEEISDITGVKLLFCSVLRRALDDWALYREQTSNKKQDKLREEARIWLFEECYSSNPLDKLMSMRSICDILDLSVSEVRRLANSRNKEDVKKISFGEIRYGDKR
jgi:hypothetical protein